ncbi:MAG: carbohydrate-binding domain-containing protein, partial [Actinomycetota bacterium]
WCPTYTFPDAETDEPNAALFSAGDLTIAGGGQLTVNGSYNDGIASKDGLVITSGTITVSAVDDGIRGKDYAIIQGGTVTIDAGGDGIKADNEEDVERGYVLVADGVVSITAGDDGIQAATDALITGGQFVIDAGSVSGTGRAVQGDVLVAVSGGQIDATSVDDTIHSNNEVTIAGGTLTLASGDDGVHGDYLVTIDGGSTTITEAFEGIESEVIVINDGFVDITSSDDGLNVADAEATTATATGPGGGGGRPGGGGNEAVGEHYIFINGGTVVITILGDLAEQGDGIDANGHVEMTGGVVAVSGPTDTRNSALDYSGGSFTMTGGTFIGTNIDGRNSEGIGAGSTQASMYLTSGSTITAGTVVQIETTDGERLITFEPANDYSVVVFSSPDLVDGASYDIYLGGTVTGDSATDLYDGTDTAGELSATVAASLVG